MDMRTALAFLSPACVAAALSGCADVPIDGNAPPPTGVLEGAVKYYGPRPLCDYDSQTGLPLRVRGRAVLLMFVYGNPPPPAGTATAPANLLTVPGSAFFSELATDCLPESPTPEDLAVRIDRSAAVSWPEIALGTLGRPVSYMVQGFYDRDEDFHPFFAAAQSPSAQDLAGAAIEDPAAPIPVLSKFTFGPASEHPAGLVVDGASVTLAAPVNTEPPIFRLASDPLASDQALIATLDAAVDEAVYRQRTHTTLELYDDLAAPEGVELLEALAAGGLSFGLAGDPAYAIYVRELDFDADGQPDPHPVLGPRGYDLLSPVVLMQRIRSALEAQAGIPDVIMLPALPAYSTAEGEPVAPGQVFTSSVPVVVPPATAIVTNPRVPVCQIATLPPASTAELYFNQLADCQELPTGRYAVNVLHGVAGGAFVPSATSPTGFDIAGGRFGGQAWTVPNELGDPAQLPPLDAPPGAPPEPDCSGPARCADAQGIGAAFLVHDPDASSTLARRTGDDACLNGPSLLAPGETQAYGFQDFDVSAVRAYVDADPDVETVEDVQALCCDPVAHLCELPLCPSVPAVGDATRMVRGSPTSVTRITWTDGSVRHVPDCIPFYVPTPCCAP